MNIDQVHKAQELAYQVYDKFLTAEIRIDGKAKEIEIGSAIMSALCALDELNALLNEEAHKEMPVGHA